MASDTRVIRWSERLLGAVYGWLHRRIAVARSSHPGMQARVNARRSKLTARLWYRHLREEHQSHHPELMVLRRTTSQASSVQPLKGTQSAQQVTTSTSSESSPAVRARPRPRLHAPR